MTRHVHLEILVGRRVRDVNDAVVGRIESVRAVWRGKECFVEEYHLGPAAFLEVLGISGARLVGWPRSKEPTRVPWEQLDLSDPEHPRLRCTREELKKMAR